MRKVRLIFEPATDVNGDPVSLEDIKEDLLNNSLTVIDIISLEEEP